MASFLTGFADGFTSAREKKASRDAEKENMMFKYQMDALVEKKSLRDKQIEKEKLWATQAKSAADRIGDPAFATEALNQFKAGRTVESVYEDIDSGNYKKDPNFKAPTKTIEMPKGVTAEAEPEATPTPEVGSKGILQKVGDNFKGMLGMKTTQEKVDSRIDGIDPNLRKTKATPVEYTQPEQATGWKYSKTNQLKLKPLGDAYLAKEAAIKSGDKAAEREADTHIKINLNVATQEAAIKAREQGKDVSMRLLVNPDGSVGRSAAVRQVVDDRGNIVYMDETDATSPQVVDGASIPIDDKGMKEYQDLVVQYGKDGADYNAAQDQYIGALYNVRKIDEILRRNPSVTSYSATGVELINTLQDEVKGAYQVLTNQEKEIENLIMSNDPGARAQLEKKIAGYEASATKFLSQANTDLAHDKAAYETLRRLAAFKFAAANGVDGRNMSDRDYREFYEATGGGKGATAVMEAMYNNAASVLNGLDARRVSYGETFGKKAEAFGKTYLMGKAKTGLVPMRLQDKLDKMGASDLTETLAAINDYKMRGRQAITGKAPVAPARPRQGTPAPKAGESSIPSGAIEKLKANPNLKSAFEAKYGAGSAAKILGE